MKTFDLELFVGFTLFCLIAILVYLSLRLGQVDLIGSQGYTVQATFTTAGGLQTGAVVELAGVEIGRVEQIALDNYQARVKLKIDDNISLGEDTKAAIKSKGLIGERYVEISPGKTGKKLEPGGLIRETESPVDIQELISQFIFGNVNQNGQSNDFP
ncbi:MAG: outer membrane lipid asymmetry maintenance protein MlaD [Candidatus Binatia bacterium]